MSNNKEDNMQMMIDIPKDDYLMIKLVREHGMGSFAMDIILNGTVLEPCTDAVSREDALKLIYDFKEKHTEDREKHPINYGTLLDLIRLIRELPSVTQKSGKWIITYPHGKQNPIYECPRCHASNSSVFKNFCPNCGYCMVEPQKSEE